MNGWLTVGERKEEGGALNAAAICEAPLGAGPLGASLAGGDDMIVVYGGWIG